MQEKKHILRILVESREAVEREDVVKLKDLSNQTIHSASIHKDIDSVAIAIIIYSLSKIIERKNYRHYKDWKRFFNHFLKHLDNAILGLEEDNLRKFRSELEGVREDIEKLSPHFKKHIKDVFRRSSINKASRIYEHGISMEHTAKLLGITMWELAEYAGKTGIGDVNLSVTLDVNRRIKLVEELFK